MKLPAFQFYADDNLSLCIGSPPPGKPSAMLHAKRFVLSSYMLDCEETGRMIKEVLSLLASRDFESLKRFDFIGRVFKGTHKRRHIPADVRRRVIGVGFCLVCGSPDKPEIDHIFPVSRGGTDDERNLRRLCKPCNLKKGAS